MAAEVHLASVPCSAAALGVLRGVGGGGSLAGAVAGGRGTAAATAVAAKRHMQPKALWAALLSRNWEIAVTSPLARGWRGGSQRRV
mmetsp:Transcript_50296/g.162851  ORF Transcript_50296/g.162851 Transcript_50296/m.162851 type:complete len:86 (-) Transcript_50296:677-934(-)